MKKCREEHQAGVRKSPSCALKSIKEKSQDSQGVFMDILK